MYIYEFRWQSQSPVLTHKKKEKKTHPASTTHQWTLCYQALMKQIEIIQHITWLSRVIWYQPHQCKYSQRLLYPICLLFVLFSFPGLKPPGITPMARQMYKLHKCSNQRWEHCVCDLVYYCLAPWAATLGLRRSIRFNFVHFQVFEKVRFIVQIGFRFLAKEIFGFRFWDSLVLSPLHTGNLQSPS